MITTIEVIPPALAKKYLALSNGNKVRQRALDRSWVQYFVRLLERGLWQTTPDGIAFHSDLWLANGHHRLWAIVISGIPAVMNVSRGLTDAEVRALDQGKRRTMADLTGIDRKIVDVMNFAWRVLSGNSKPPFPEDVLEAIDLPFGKKLFELKDLCSSNSKVFGASAMKCAATFWALKGAQDYAFQQYRALNLMNCDELSPISSLLVKRVTLGHLGGVDRYILFALGMKVFNPANSEFKKLYTVKEESFEEFRKISDLVYNDLSKEAN